MNCININGKFGKLFVVLNVVAVIIHVNITYVLLTWNTLRY